jgi:glycosyltransferase involved in cell wall biosynthesis
MKLFEYAASGVPMIVARQPTTLSLVRDGEQALLVSPDSAQDLADAVKRLMTSPELAARLAARAREWVRQYAYAERARRYQEFLALLHRG